MAQSPSIEVWDRRFGGTNSDEFESFQQTNDSGFIVGGSSISTISGDKTQSCRGSYDYWLVKIDQGGIKQWDKRYGGSGYDNYSLVQSTLDKGYIVGGFSDSPAGGDKSQPTWGGWDYWLVKIDSLGNKQWDKDFGGAQDDYLYSVIQTLDGGYILGGASWSGVGGDKTQANWDSTESSPDYWILKIDSSGDKQWDKRYGGRDVDILINVVPTGDGGYLLGGTTTSDSGCDISQPAFGLIDYWLVKVDSLGNKKWDKRFGGLPGTESILSAVSQTIDGGFIIGGYSPSDSGGTKTQNTKGGNDYWIIKIDSSGNEQWDKDYGSTSDDLMTAITITSDSGYIISGGSFGNMSGDKSENNLGYAQTWIIKTDASGNKQWDKTIFTVDNNEGNVIQTIENCYVVGVGTNSGVGGYKTQPNRDPTDSTGDYWIVKFCFTGIGESICDLTTNLQFNVYPNPFSNVLDMTLAQQNLSRATFTITNLLGQTVYAQNETNLGPTYTKMVDLSYLPNGVYWVSVVVDGERVTREVVKQ